MRLRSCLAVSCLIASICGARAHAAGPREFARLERIDVEPWYDGLARVRAWLTLIHLDGRPIEPIKAEDLQLVIGSSKKPDVPWVAPWEGTDDDLHIAILVEIGTPYASAMEYLDTVVPEFIKKLPKHAQVAVMGYGSKVTRGRLGDLRAAQRAFKKLQAEDQEDAELQLAKGIDAAVKVLGGKELERPRNSVRRLIVLISDGIEGNGEFYTELKTDAGVELDPLQQQSRADMRKRLKKAFKAAADAGVAIHSIGFSPYGNRFPMRNLGQAAVKTAGTLRLAKDLEMIEGQLGNLVDEIKRQRVLSYLVPAESVASAQNVSIWCKSPQCGPELPLKSNTRKLVASRCGGAECSPGEVCVEKCTKLEEAGGGSWLLWVLGIVGVVGVGGGGFVLAKRRREQQAALIGGAVAVAPAPPVAAPMTGVRAAVGAPAPVPMAAPHPAPRPAAHAAAAPQAALGWLLVMSGPRQGQNIPLHHGFTIGKAPGNNLVIDDGFTSGRHAQIVADAQGASIIDVGSTNGTFVNGVHTMSAHLVNGTNIRIGQTELRFIKG